VAIKDGTSSGVLPTMETIADGSYKPLSRPIFIYVSKKAAERPEVDAIVKYYLGDGLQLAKEVGYIPLPEGTASTANKRYSDRVTGSSK
jgi:phosphate transport system substrate-binding protein